MKKQTAVLLGLTVGFVVACSSETEESTTTTPVQTESEGGKTEIKINPDEGEFGVKTDKIDIEVGDRDDDKH